MEAIVVTLQWYGVVAFFCFSYRGTAFWPRCIFTMWHQPAPMTFP